jgi:predicted nuclease of predicted toxin-antitoxin system
MRFLGDMGVSWRVIEWLRAGGHDAVHLRDEGLQRLPNGDIFHQFGTIATGNHCG